MSHLIKTYLDTKFPVTNTDWKPEDIINHFMTEFGVGVKVEPHTDNKYLVQCKYDMIDAKWQHDVTHHCRGLILRNSHGGWETVAHPFNKFFNQHEGHCRIYKEDDFNKNCHLLSFMEKVDGTCIQVWFDTYKNEWRASTLGTITPVIVHDTGVKFDDLFWKVATQEITKCMVPGNTYIFELCTTLNRVVTRYPVDCAYILGVRKADGSFMHRSDIELAFMPILSNENGPKIFMPSDYSFAMLNITNLKDAQDWIEKQASQKAKYGEYPEGFVVYDAQGPVCKMKNSAYLALHHSLSDSACTRNAVIAAFFKGTMDDLYPALPEVFQKFADALKAWLDDFKNYLNTQVAAPFHGEPFKSRKDYALYVQALPERERMFRGFFFSNQEDICDPNKDLGEVFSQWIRANFEKYEDYWKSLCN